MRQKTNGKLEIVCGCMFAGKTTSLIRKVKEAEAAERKVVIFKPAIDDRYSEVKIVSHDGEEVSAIVIHNSAEILQNIDDETEMAAIDEAQFLDEGLVAVVEEMADCGIHVICTGLDTDFRGEPFGMMPQLLARAETVRKIHAVCACCGREATRTQRIVNGKPANYHDPLILVGASESYEARCRWCHDVPGKP